MTNEPHTFDAYPDVDENDVYDPTWDEGDPDADCEYEPDRLPGEDMDGDFNSAMASAGLGTNEDYGDYGGDGDEWFYPDE